MRPIDADKLKEALVNVKVVVDSDVLELETIHDILVYILAKADVVVMETIDNQPTIEAVPVVHGEWLHHERPNSIWAICSVCNHPLGAFSYKFCPMCGAKMDGKAV